MNAPKKMPDWAYNQMLEGLQKLLILRLQGAPPADTITALATVWEEALTPLTRHWQQDLDSNRLPEAFRRVIQQSSKWVAPAQLIEQIPARQVPPIAGLIEAKHPPLTPEQIAKNKQRLKQILQILAQAKQL
ncbi:MAG: hypothetical protein Q4B82_08355 [Alysiella sp.]|uniref:hypothetical protein n=1 Tax=Alysiella sp. TaxID=1872483 RepID=UPI0026DD98FF|nr:hypothetical protein [Alysiella sp.]MDO4434573.1 hypothetical protein [Alysiella sp.]